MRQSFREKRRRFLYRIGILYWRERLELLKVARDERLETYGLAFLESGNLGTVTPEGVIVSPSGKSFVELTYWNMAFVPFDGNDIDQEGNPAVWWGRFKPTSEWRIYWVRGMRHLINGKFGVVMLHLHPCESELFSCMHIAIPGNVIYTIFGASENLEGIPCSAFFELPSTPELALDTDQKMGNGKATFIASHGQFVEDKNARAVVSRAMRVDRAAYGYKELLKLSAAGHPWVPMDQDQLLALPGLYGNYGQPKKK